MQVWEAIPYKSICCLNRGMLRHCRECTEARGGHAHIIRSLQAREYNLESVLSGLMIWVSTDQPQ